MIQAHSPAKWQLLLEDTSGDTPERLAINNQTMTIGQAADNDLALADDTIAAHQLRLSQQRGQLIIEDLQPATLVNAEPLTGPYALQPNDVIQLGRYKLRVVANQPAPTITTPTTAIRPAIKSNLPLWLAAGALILFLLGCPPALFLLFMWQRPIAIPVVVMSSPTTVISLNLPTPTATTALTEIMPTDTVTFTVPTIFIQQAPVANSQIQLTQTVTIVAMAADPSGVARLELWVNGEQVDSATADNTTSMSAALEWLPTEVGQYELELRAQNQLGLTSNLVATTVQVGDELAFATETIMPTVDTATLTPTATLTRPSPTVIPRPVIAANPPPIFVATATREVISDTTIPVVAAIPTSQNILRAPEGKTLVIIGNRTIQNTPATLTLSQGKSVGGGKQINLDSGQEVQLILEPDHYHVLWSAPVRGFAVDRDITAQAGKIIVMWVIPEYKSSDIEYYDQLILAAPPPSPTPMPSAPLPTPQPGKALFITANRSFENLFARLTLTGGTFGGGQEFTIDANTETQLELTPGDYRAIWYTPGHDNFTAGRDFTVVAGQIILSWIVPEKGQIFMQFPGEAEKQVNN